MLAESYWNGGFPDAAYQGGSPKDYGFYMTPPSWEPPQALYGRTCMPNPPDAAGDNLVFRHFADYSEMNLLFFDGHVDSVSYKQTFPSGYQSNRPPADSPFISMLTWPDPFSH